MSRAAEAGLRPARIAPDPRLQLQAGSVPPRIGIRDLRVEPVTRLGKRSGVKLVARVRVEGGRGQPLVYQAGFRLPSGVPVRSEASHYRDDQGRLRASARTAPLAHDDAAFDDLWIFVPFGAFALAAGTHDLDALLELSAGPEATASARCRFLLVQPEAGAARAPDAPGPGPDDDQGQEPTLEVTGVGLSGPIGCGVCHSEVVGAAWVCPRCRAVHHQDCWSFNRGCSTYGCGEGDRTGEPGRE